MPALSRTSDIGEGTCPTKLPSSTVEHGDYVTTFITGASTVFTNNQAQAIVSTKGDQDSNCEAHKGDHPTGDNLSTALTGSSTVFVENQPIHRIGDTGEGAGGDTYTSLTGSPNVFNDDVTGAGSADDGLADLPPEFSTAATATIRKEMGRYAPLDDPPSIGLTPKAYGRDTNAPPVTAGTGPEVSTTPATTPVQGDCGGSETPNYSLALTTNYTLGSFSQNTLWKHNIQAQAGFSVSAIVCNLKALATEIVEPINTQYPGVRINSGFRTFTKGTSQHEKGQACDLQWQGLAPRDYLPRAEWIIANLPFDQLIFEHGNTIWLHVSFNRNAAKQRKQVLTMINGSYQPGLKCYY